MDTICKKKSNNKENIFIIDISGSMKGEKIAKTKKAVEECLKELSQTDKFNIVAFESEYESLNFETIENNSYNITQAIKYIDNLTTIGGTEILEPIKFALKEIESEKCILLFTDGQVGNEEKIIKYVEENINKSKIYPFGIDKNVNFNFLKRLAKVGKGKAELIENPDKLDEEIINSFKRIKKLKQ